MNETVSVFINDENITSEEIEDTILLTEERLRCWGLIILQEIWHLEI